MSDRCINLADWESRALLDGSLSLLWRPVHGDPRLIGGVIAGPPGAPGDTLLGREVWRYLSQMENPHRVDYRTDSAIMQPSRGWRSAVTMPRWAVRHRLRIVDVIARRLSTMTQQEAEMAGCVDDDIGRNSRGLFYARWNARRAWPRWQTHPWVWRVEVEAEK